MFSVRTEADGQPAQFTAGNQKKKKYDKELKAKIRSAQKIRSESESVKAVLWKTVYGRRPSLVRQVGFEHGVKD